MKVKNFAIKDRIVELREEKNISQSELSNAIGCGKTIVYYWETGQREPNSQMLVALSKFFNVSTDYLLGLEDEFGNKPEKMIIKKTSSGDLSAEEIEMIKKIRLLGPYEQTYIKAQIDALSDTAKSKQKEKI